MLSGEHGAVLDAEDLKRVLEPLPGAAARRDGRASAITHLNGIIQSLVL
jgi:hypothetical protein